MIFGQQQDDSGGPAPQSNRVPFTRPPEAGQNFVPGSIKTAYQSHLRPFAHVMQNMVGVIPRLPGFSPMGPGSGVRVNPPQSQSIRQQLPSVVAPPGTSPLPTSAAAQAAAAAAVAPGQTGPDGVSGWGFGAPMHAGGGGRNVPYRVMRSGFIPSIPGSGRNIRRGVYGAAGFIHRQMPSAFPGAAAPAGGYYPLREMPAPAPVVAMTPAGTHGWGRW